VSPQSKRAAPAKSPYRAFYWILIAVALVGIGALVFAVVRARTGGSAAMAPVKIDSTSLRAIAAKATPEKLGPDNAPVKLVIFSDYTCPYCGQWAAQVQPRLMQDYVNPGKLQIVYYDFPLGTEGEHKYAYLAARAAHCGGEQGKYWEMHDYIFGRQSDWMYALTPPVKTYEQYARTVGVDPQKFNACLESDRYADVVTAEHELGVQLGVNATPTVIINERRLSDPGLQDYNGLKQTIEQAAGTGAR